MFENDAANAGFEWLSLAHSTNTPWDCTLRIRTTKTNTPRTRIDLFCHSKKNCCRESSLKELRIKDCLKHSHIILHTCVNTVELSHFKVEEAPHHSVFCLLASDACTPCIQSQSQSRPCTPCTIPHSSLVPSLVAFLVLRSWQS